MAETEAEFDHRKEFKELVASFPLDQLGELILMAAAEFNAKAHELAPAGQKAAMMMFGPTDKDRVRVAIASGPMIDTLKSAVVSISNQLEDLGLGTHFKAGESPIPPVTSGVTAGMDKLAETLTELTFAQASHVLMTVAGIVRRKALGEAGAGMEQMVGDVPLMRIGPARNPINPSETLMVAMAAADAIAPMIKHMEGWAANAQAAGNAFTLKGHIDKDRVELNNPPAPIVNPPTNPNDKPN